MKACLIAITSFASIATTATAADLHVPLPYVSIQSAINAAATGDTIMLAPGTYNENIALNGKDVTIRAFNTNFETVIDGGQAGPVVTFSGAESDKCVIRDLTLRNGKAESGAGIRGNSTLATIRDCIIGGNIATGSGGGVHGLSGLIRNCTITLNQAQSGGGIAACDGTIDSCRITLNKALASGGGVDDLNGTMRFCEVLYNEAATSGGGIDQSSGIILGNLISGNKVTAVGPVDNPASRGGGANNISGIFTLNHVIANISNGDGGGISNSTALMQNNIFAENTARRGGGLSNSNGRIENNTIWGNSASHQGGGCFNLGTGVANCIVAGNGAPVNAEWAGANIPVFSCILGWQGNQPDIIADDPQIENPANGQYRLLPGSPCIDAGKLIAEFGNDFEGDPRPFDGTPEPRGDGSDFDIGADEFMPANIDVAATWADIKVKSKGKPGKIKTKLQGKLYIASVGTDPVPAAFAAQFFLSADPVWDPSDQPVGKVVTVKKLKTGKSKKAKCKIKLPVNQVVTGQYLIGVADSGNSVIEGNEGNNIAVSGPLP